MPVARHVGAHTGAGGLAPHRVSGSNLEALHQRGDRQAGWVGDQQVHVVGFAVELHRRDAELGACRPHRVLGEGGHRVVKQSVLVFGHAHQVGGNSDTLWRARR
jgi:hypothetical protein